MPFPQPSIPCYLDNSLFFSVHLHKAAGTGLCLSTHRRRVKPNWGAPSAQVLSFQGCPFQLCMVVRSRQLCPRDFCLPAAGLLRSSMLRSSFPTCVTRSLCSLSWKHSTTALLWVDDKILSPVPLSLHVWVMLQQRHEKYRSDYRCSVMSVITQHTLPATWPKFWKYKSSNITFNTVPNWQRWELCHHFYQWLVLQ